MTREKAIALYRSLPTQGSYVQRMRFKEAGFPIGLIAEDLWHAPEFTYGVDYGIMIGLAEAFELTPEDLR